MASTAGVHARGCICLDCGSTIPPTGSRWPIGIGCSTCLAAALAEVQVHSSDVPRARAVVDQRTEGAVHWAQALHPVPQPLNQPDAVKPRVWTHTGCTADGRNVYTFRVDPSSFSGDGRGTYLSPRALVFLQGRLDPRVMEHVLEVLARAKWARTQAHHEHQQGQYQPSCQASDMFARSSGDSSCSGCSSSSGSRDCGSAVCKPCRYTPEVRANAACKNSSKESAAVQEGTRIPACGMLPFLGLLSKLRTKKCGGAKSPGRKGQGAPSHAGCGSDGAVVMGLDEAGAVLEGLGARCSMYGIQVLEGCYRTTGAGVSAAGASLQQWWDVQLTSVY